MNRIQRITALAAAVLMLLPCIGSNAEVTAEKTMNRKQVESITWKDENGNIAEGPDGYATVRYEYEYQKVTERYYDADGFPCMSNGGYYGRIVTRDTRDKISSIEYIGLDGKRMLTRMGYAMVTYRYFSFINSEQLIVFYGADGRPIVVPSLGYAQVEIQYSGNTLTGRVYMDATGNRIDNADGYAAMQKKMNRQRLIIREWYEHADGTPATGPAGWSRSEIARDPDNDGRITKIEYFDEAGNLTAAGGFAREEYSYDKDGMVTLTRYDADGNVISFGGDAVSVRRRIKNDQIKQETFLDASGEPTTLPAGYAGISYSYNSDGRIVLTQYMDEAGEKTTCNQGYSAIRTTWDVNGQLLSQTYLDENGNPVNNAVSGVSEERFEYDEEGKMTGSKQYDASGNLTDGNQ